MRSGLTAASLARALTTPIVSNWIPVTRVSLLAAYAAYGDDPGRHLLTGVALHAASSVLLFLVLLRDDGCLVAKRVRRSRVRPASAPRRERRLVLGSPGSDERVLLHAAARRMERVREISFRRPLLRGAALPHARTALEADAGQRPVRAPAARLLASRAPVTRWRIGGARSRSRSPRRAGEAADARPGRRDQRGLAADAVRRSARSPTRSCSRSPCASRTRSPPTWPTCRPPSGRADSRSTTPTRATRSRSCGQPRVRRRCSRRASCSSGTRSVPRCSSGGCGSSACSSRSSVSCRFARRRAPTGTCTCRSSGWRSRRRGAPSKRSAAAGRVEPPSHPPRPPPCSRWQSSRGIRWAPGTTRSRSTNTPSG